MINPNSLKPAPPPAKPLVTLVVFNKNLLSGALGNIGKLHRMSKSEAHVSENSCKFKYPLFARAVVVGESLNACLANRATICCPVEIKTANSSNLKTKSLVQNLELEAVQLLHILVSTQMKE